MATITRVVLEGYLPTAEGILYTCPALTTASLSEMNLHNINATTQTVIISVRSNAISRIIGRMLMLVNYTARRGPGAILQAGDTLRGVTTTANAVHYNIAVVEES